MKRAVIISGGKIQTDFALAFLRTQTWDYVIGADKGVIFCHKNQIMPTHIVGDFDSAGETEYEYFQKNTDVPIKRLNPVKDYTDTDVALRLALELGAEEITILGGTRMIWKSNCHLLRIFRNGLSKSDFKIENKDAESLVWRIMNFYQRILGISLFRYRDSRL